tara:strand:+ start:26 stop:274 length:249 start_codon:yes stop_codon:yes gene_type:complete
MLRGDVMSDYKHEYAVWKRAKGTTILPDGNVERKTGDLRIIYTPDGQRRFRWAWKPRRKPTARQDNLYILQLLLVVFLLQLC